MQFQNGFIIKAILVNFIFGKHAIITTVKLSYFFIWDIFFSLVSFLCKKERKAFIFHSFFRNPENMYKQYGHALRLPLFCLTSAKSGLV